MQINGSVETRETHERFASQMFLSVFIYTGGVSLPAVARGNALTTGNVSAFRKVTWNRGSRFGVSKLQILSILIMIRADSRVRQSRGV